MVLIRRLAVTATLLAGSALVAGSTLGRVAEDAAMAPKWWKVAAPLASAIPAALGYRALAEGDLALADADARRALAASPLNDRALELLVRVRNAQRRGADERRILAVSQGLTRRNLPLRLMLMSDAAPAGRFAQAIRDADLLLRQNAYGDQLFAYLGQATAFPAARAALVPRLAARPRWRHAFLTSLRGLDPEGHEDHLLILAALAHTPAPPTPEEITAIARRILDAGEVDLARRLRATFSPLPPGSLLLDQRFARTDRAAAGLTGWALPNGVAAIGDQGRGLAIGMAGSGRLAEQVTFLAPGRYRLTWRVQGMRSTALDALQWTLRCSGSSTAFGFEPPLVAGQGNMLTVMQSVRVAGCPMQRLALNSEGGTQIDPAARLLWTSLEPIDGTAPQAGQ